jgi:hypothetical protein
VHNAENYFVKNGVHRSVVARETGKTKIKAEVFDANDISQGIQDIPLTNLHTTKDFVRNPRFSDLKDSIETVGMKTPIEVEILGLSGQGSPTTCIIDVMIY